MIYNINTTDFQCFYAISIRNYRTFDLVKTFSSHLLFLVKCFLLPSPDPDYDRVEDGIQIRGALRDGDLAEEDAQPRGQAEAL